jgi:phospholipid/cholesterol/gamma-HCH transport system substrate-binding protein
MSRNANYYKIGLFVIGAVVLGLAALVVLGAGTLFRQEVYCESYFTESVQGLDIGSPVKFRGVQIGNVKEITLVAKKYDTDKRYVLVRSALFPEAFRLKNRRVNLKEEVEQGLRVRLAIQGLTGTAYLEADYVDPERFPPLQIDWQPAYTVIPSAPSTITRLSDALDSIMHSLREIDIQKIAESTQESLVLLSQALESAHIGKIGKQTEQLLAELRETNRLVGGLVAKLDIEPVLADVRQTAAVTREMMQRIEKSLAPVLDQLPGMAGNLNRLAARLGEASKGLPDTMQQFKATLRRVDYLISSQQQDIETTIENVRTASQNLRELTENAKKYPAQILFGRPPNRPELGGD